MPYPLAVLVSGSGSNLQSILDKIEAGWLDAEVRVVVSNNPEAKGLSRVDKRRARALSHKDFPTREAFDAEVVRIINDHGVRTGQGAVILAGYMRLLSPVFLRAFPQRILNIHPAILPSFPGTHGAADAAKYGVRLAGCSVHFVDEIMDNGPVIIQAAVPALPGEGGDSLAARILRLEHCVYPQAIRWLTEDRLAIEGRHVHVRGAESAAFGRGANPWMTSPGLEHGFRPGDKGRKNRA